jgi:hypothetical protein
MSTVNQSPVKNAFTEYFDEMDSRKANKEATAVVEKAQKVAKEKAPKVAKEPKVNDKKVAAQRIFDANTDKGNGEIARMIAEQLEITYANAYYYVTRAFKR